MDERRADPWPERQRELLDLLRTGENIEAIRRYREWSGLGLAESKAAIEQLERTGSLPLPPAPPSLELPPKLEMEIIKLLHNQNKIQAIKLYRDHAGCGLKDGKDAVEEIGRRHGLPVSSGCAGVLLIGVAGLFAWVALVA